MSVVTDKQVRIDKSVLVTQQNPDQYFIDAPDTDSYGCSFPITIEAFTQNFECSLWNICFKKSISSLFGGVFPSNTESRVLYPMRVSETDYVYGSYFNKTFVFVVVNEDNEQT